MFLACWRQHVPQYRKRAPTRERVPTLHFWSNFRCVIKLYSNKCPPWNKLRVTNQSAIVECWELSKRQVLYISEACFTLYWMVALQCCWATLTSYTMLTVVFFCLEYLPSERELLRICLCLRALICCKFTRMPFWEQKRGGLGTTLISTCLGTSYRYISQLKWRQHQHYYHLALFPGSFHENGGRRSNMCS